MALLERDTHCFVQTSQSEADVGTAVTTACSGRARGSLRLRDGNTYDFSC